MGALVRRGGLNVTVPKLKKYMSEQRCALTKEMTAELLGVNESTAHNILFYMEATGIVQRVKRGKSFYFLKGVYDEDQVEVLLIETGAKAPKRKAKPAKRVRKRSRRRNLYDEHFEAIRSSAD